MKQYFVKISPKGAAMETKIKMWEEGGVLEEIGERGGKTIKMRKGSAKFSME